MNLAEQLSQIGAELEIFHLKTLNAVDFGAYMSDGEVKFFVWIATDENIRHEFSTAQVLIDWLKDVNGGVDPFGSAMLRKKAETMQAQKIIRDAELAAVLKEVGELPETQEIKNAEAAASKMLAEANEKLGLITLAKTITEEDAAGKELELATVLKSMTPEQVQIVAALLAAKQQSAELTGDEPVVKK